MPLSSIDPPANRHRVEISEESIHDLAKDIRDRGLMNPITVRQLGDRYEVVAGERRYTAVKFLGWPVVECRNLGPVSDDECEAFRLAENLQRENLSPFEEAIQITALHQVMGGDIVATAKACHRSHDWIKQRIALYGIQPDLQPLLHEKHITIGAALQLARIEDAKDREYYTRLARFDGCTVDVLTRWVNDYHTQRLTNPDADPTHPAMPEPGQHIVVYLDCNLCGKPTDTRTRTPKFVCPACTRLWTQFTAAYNEAHAYLESEQTLDQVPQ